MRGFVLGLIGVVMVSFAAAGQKAFSLPGDCSQVVLGLAEHWNDSHVTYQRWERGAGGWEKSGASWPGRLGKNGLAWGLGLHPGDLKGLQKVEGDARAPAGVFALGAAYGYEASVACRAGQEYHRITPLDLWVEDVESPYYNQHLKIKNDRALTEWEKKQQMRQGDEAHALKLFIAHNAPPAAQPGKGSAIFFHIWRENGGKSSHGCSVMPEERLRELIAWVDPKKKPLYILLPREEYERYATSWGLPRK